MKVYIDESGDSGFKFDKNSSKYFTIALVVFHTDEDAENCNERIRLLKSEMGKREDFEFHFVGNSFNIREQFLKAIATQNFFYYAFVMDKQKLYSEHFKTKEVFYKYVAGWVLENAKEHLENAEIVMDKNGDAKFKKELSRHIKSVLNGPKKRISDVKMRDSKKINNLQLVDYIASAINRIQTKKDFDENPLKYIKHREVYVQIWPK